MVLKIVRKCKLFVLVVVSIAVLIWQFTNIEPIRRKGNETTDPDEYPKARDEQPIPLRVFHLDLKGAPPKMTYLEDVLAILQQSGINAILVEYEDTFPYEGVLRNISSTIAYSKNQIVKFVALCESRNIEVIPLVQTFGHMEYILKLRDFEHLREIEDSTREICPSNAKSIELLEEMINQVMAVHKNAKRFHIGCDEVFNLNVCDKCRKRRLNSRDIFVQHVKTISTIISDKYPRVATLMWDDMLRTWPAYFVQISNLNDYVQPVIWVYGNNIVTLIPPTYWYWYFKHFRNIWIAGAFKGATGEMAIVPGQKIHYQNQNSWLRFMAKYERELRTTNLAGYILAGWSRYDHFAAICELLPVSIPSLVVNSLVITQAADIAKNYAKILKCPGTNALDVTNVRSVKECDFPGNDLFLQMLELIEYQNETNILYDKLYENNAWMTYFHLKRRSTNVSKIRRLIEEYKFTQFKNKFSNFRDALKSTMGKYYENETIVEWFEERIEFYANKIQFLDECFKKLIH